MIWQVKYFAEAAEDFASLDGNQKILVRKAIKKVQQNPLPRAEGGYGIPLGNRGNRNLANFLEIKLLGAGIRVIYKLIRTETEMHIIVIGMRRDEEVYDIAKKRAEIEGGEQA